MHLVLFEPCQRLEEIPKPPPCDLQLLTVPEEYLARTAGQRSHLPDRTQIDERGPRYTKEAIPAESLLKLAQRRIHPIFTFVGHQARKTAFGPEVQNARLLDHEIPAAAPYQETS